MKYRELWKQKRGGPRLSMEFSPQPSEYQGFFFVIEEGRGHRVGSPGPEAFAPTGPVILSLVICWAGSHGTSGLLPMFFVLWDWVQGFMYARKVSLLEPHSQAFFSFLGSNFSNPVVLVGPGSQGRGWYCSWLCYKGRPSQLGSRTPSLRLLHFRGHQTLQLSFKNLDTGLV
jgi:hypothetical protein